MAVPANVQPSNPTNPQTPPASNPNNPNMLGVRDTLNKQFNIDNNRIGYNVNNGMVQVDGQDVFKPLQNIDGTTYTTQDQFNSVGGKLNQMNRMYNLQNQMQSPQNLNPYQNQIGDTLNQLKQMQGQMNTPVDPYSSPQYQAAQAQQNYNAQQATRQVQESLGESGFGRSTNLMDRAQQIQNDKNNYLMSQVVPQIVQQLQAQRQQQFQNAQSLLSPLLQMNQQANETAFNQQNGAMKLLDMLNQQRMQEAGLTGKLDGQDTMAGAQNQAQLTGLLPNGAPSYAAQQQAIQNAIARASAFGTITNPEDAQMLGVPLGTNTRELQALLYKNQYDQGLLNAKNRANDIAEQRAGNQNIVDKARANYYNNQVQNGKNSAENNAIAGQVFDHAQDFQSPQDVEDYFKANGQYLAQHLGADATTKMKNDFLSEFNADNKQSNSLYDKALAAAQKDPNWLMPDADQAALVKKYQDLISKTSGN